MKILKLGLLSVCLVGFTPPAMAQMDAEGAMRMYQRGAVQKKPLRPRMDAEDAMRSYQQSAGRLEKQAAAQQEQIRLERESVEAYARMNARYRRTHRSTVAQKEHPVKAEAKPKAKVKPKDRPRP